MGNVVPKENMYYACIACITIDSVMKTNKKYYPQVYLEECKYKIKKIQMSRFINTELESDSDSESDAKLKSNSDNDSGYDTVHLLQILMIIYSHECFFMVKKKFFF